MEHTLARNSLLSRVFAGLFASLLSASLGLFAGQYVPPTVIFILMLVEFAMIIAAMVMQRRRSIGMPFVLVFTFISGLTLFPAIAMYTTTLGAYAVLKAVGVSAAAFLIASIAASRTSLDFSWLGGFLFVGLMAVLVMGLVSFFVGFSTLAGLIYSLLGIAVFIGYVLYDVNRLVHHGATEQMVPWIVLSLYLDFINLFLFVLRLMGILQDSRR
jgi:uncharacterized protein